MAIAMIVLMAGCAGNGGAPFTITTTSGQLATVVVNSSYPATTFAAANGTAPYTWAWTGNTPPGLSLSTAGMLSGTPTSFGTFSFTVTVTDAATPTAHTATANLSVLINPALTSVAMNPSTVTGGTSSTGTVTLGGSAAASAVVTLASNSAAAVVPANVTVAAGATTATFQATTSGVNASTPATITATYGVAKTANLTVNAPTVASVTLAQATITGGTGTTGTVTLTGPAATGGDSVVLSSNNAAAQVPATVTVAAGATSAQFNVTSTAVVSSVTATIQASFNSSMQSAPLLTVVPAPAITSFTRAAATITTGTSTTLTALFSNGTGSISNSVGAVTSGTPVTVSPTATTNYTLTVTNAAGSSVTQQTTVTVVPVPVITSFTSAAMTITAGTSTTLTATFSSGTGSVNNSVGAVTSGTPVTVSPAATTTYTLSVSNSATTPDVVTSTVTVTVVPAPSITSFAPAVGTIVLGNSTTLTAVFSNGTGSVDNSVGAVTSGTPVTVQPTVTTTYTLTVTNLAGTKVTMTAQVIVDTPPGISSGASTTFAVGANGTFTVQATGNPQPSLLEAGTLPSGVMFVDNGNGTGTLHGIPATGTDAGSPYHFTITASNGVSPAFVQNFTLNVSLVQAPAITANPTSQTDTVGTTATFTAAASGVPAPTVQWQISTNGGSTFTNISGATSTTLSLTGVTLAQSTDQYRAVFTNSVNSATSNAATLTVVAAPAITSFTAAASTITVGGSTTLTGVFTGGTGSVNNSVGAVTSGTAVTVSPSVTTTYTLTVTNSATTPATVTQTVTVNVVAAPVITSFVPGASTITSGTSTTLTAVFGSGTGSVDNGVGAVTTGTPVTVSPTTTTTYTLTVTNAANTKTTATATIMVQAPPNITSNNSTTFTVAVNGNFTVQTTGSPAPSLIETGALPTNVNFVDNGNGTATISGAPAVGSAASYPITITASNGVGTDATQSFTLNVVADPCSTIVGGNEALLTGHYAFVLKGFDNGTTGTETGPEPALVGGVLVFNGTNNNGQITAGTLDMNLNATAGVLSQTVTGGTYKINSATDHRGCMAITTAGGTQHYRFSLGNIVGGVASTGHMIDFDSTGPFTAGELLKQSSTIPTTVSGNFAFGVSSAQNTASTNGNSGSGGVFGAIGTMTFASNGTLTAGNVDFNQNGFLDGSSTVGGSWPSTGASLSAGSYSIAASGRGTFTFTPGGGSPVHTIIYVVSSSEFLILDNDDQTQNSVFGGSALLQSAASFSANPLSGNYVGYQSGLGSTSGTSSVTLFLLDASGTGISGTQLRNDGGSFQSKSLSGITYTVASSGRMTITAGGGSNNPLFYVVSPSQVFFLSSDTDVAAGFFQLQSGSPFTNSSASGTYAFGTVDPQDSNVSMNSGVAMFATPNISVTEDDNSNGSQNADQSQSVTYSIDSTGLGHLPSGCTISSNSTTCSTILYVISPTKAVVLDTGSSNAKVQIADQ